MQTTGAIPSLGLRQLICATVSVLAMVASASGQTAKSDEQWTISRFVPVSVTTWWANLGNLIEETGAYPDRVVRTADGGHSWRDVTPPVATPATQEAHGTVLGYFFLDEK